MKLYSFDIFPFTKIYWQKDDQGFRNMVSRASRLSHLVEYETVKQHLRKVATFHIRPQGFEDEIEKIAEDGLFWLPIQRSKIYSGFSHKHFPTSKDDPQSTVYGVLSWKLEYAKQFKEASKGKCDHEKLAELLGYPACCAKFFTKVWSQGYYDPIYQAAENTKGMKKSGRTIELKSNGYANSSMRYFGLRIVPQITCSFSCKASEEQGRMFFEVMQDIDREAANFLLDYLKGPEEWSVYHGIAQVVTDDFVGITNSMPTTEKFVVNVRR